MSLAQRKRGPLDGIVVVDLTRALSGPYSTMLLSELGAKVIKIEPPGGDGSRNIGPFVNNKSAYFTSVNRGKQSISLDLKKTEDKKLFEDLLSIADVLIENYRPGVLTRLGYSWEHLKKTYPKLVYGALSGFGQTGPYRNRPAYDMIVQAMGGIMSITGHPNSPPTRVGTSIGDIVPAIFMACAVNSALYARSVNGGFGTMIDVSMLDCQVAILENAIARYFTTGNIPGPNGSRHPSASPFQVFKTKDGHISITATSKMKILCELLGNPSLSSDSRFDSTEKRLRHADELELEIEKCTVKKTTDEWMEILLKNGIPCGPLYDVRQVVNDPHIQSRNMIVQTNDGVMNNIKLAGTPMKFSDYHDPDSRPAAPQINEHRNEILDFLQSKL